MATKSKTLYGLIADLHIIARDFDKMFGENYKNLVAQLVAEIGKTTAYDTGVVRDIIANILYDLGKPELVSELEYRIFEFWKTRERRELQNNSDYSVSVNNNVDYDIMIDDYGFYKQQMGKVSSIHPRQDTNVIPYNVDFCIDQLETASNPRLELLFEELNNIIVDTIEKGV